MTIAGGVARGGGGWGQAGKIKKTNRQPAGWSANARQYAICTDIEAAAMETATAAAAATATATLHWQQRR